VRRTLGICVFLVALVVPAAASALQLKDGDGTLVVTNGTAPRGTPVVTLVIKGAAIGHLDAGRVVIQDLVPNDPNSPEVTGFSWKRDSQDLTETTYGGVGQNFRFRAVGGAYKITIYGQGVDLVASGTGNVVLAGSPDAGGTDGKYSLNGQDFRSLPDTPTKQLQIGVSNGSTG
jgi:hypothetical protein